MGTEEKKLKQTLLFIAFILLLFGYYSTHRSTDNSRLKHSVPEIHAFPHDTDNKVLRSGTLSDDIKHEETEYLIPNFEHYNHIDHHLGK